MKGLHLFCFTELSKVNHNPFVDLLLGYLDSVRRKHSTPTELWYIGTATQKDLDLLGHIRLFDDKDCPMMACFASDEEVNNAIPQAILECPILRPGCFLRTKKVEFIIFNNEKYQKQLLEFFGLIQNQHNQLGEDRLWALRQTELYQRELIKRIRWKHPGAMDDFAPIKLPTSNYQN